MSLVDFKKNNMRYFKELNNKSYIFNKKNNDFFKTYDESSFTKRIILKKQVKLLKCSGEISGFIWYEVNNDIVTINSMYVDGNKSELYKEFINLIEAEYFQYYCEKNDINLTILNDIGFTKREGNLVLKKKIENRVKTSPLKDIWIRTLIKGKDEAIRCRIQNEIFDNKNRIPLTINDIYFDEIQDYCIEGGSLFIENRKEVIGYGQIILEHGRVTIVNFGIISNYRGLGYGELFINELINILYNKNCKEVYIKVDSRNIKAYNLYKKVGFNLEKEINLYKFKK
ncbi:MAG: GNAT family N-acetyltransferase [Clostridiaceae bacterium]